MEKNYNASEVEKKWREYWIDNKTFKSEVDYSKPSYTILIPPPNITGVLHLGHILNNSLQDFLIRVSRKRGYNSLWVPGFDHASIATEAKVVGMLREKGIKKSDLSREEFLKYCWEWKEKYGTKIIDQLKDLGASCDWDRVNFTLDENYRKGVIRVFVDLYNKGYIYKGNRIINWDCEAKTALSNEEVIYNEKGESSELFYLKYKFKNSDKYLTIATTRPETIFADQAVAVNPLDNRFKDIIGEEVIIPLIDKPIKVIVDKYVDKEFGTGCLKVTPAHDINDYEIGLRHDLENVDILNDDGTLNDLCQYPDFVGKDRFEVRKLIKTKLEEEDLLVKVESIINKIARSERTHSVVEPKLSLQWYISMEELSKKAYDVVMNDEVEYLPKFYKNIFNHWMTNIRDWCVSRQLWWGHRIPAYYLPNGEYVVAETKEEAYNLAIKLDKSLKIEDLKQDEDVMDTWASSWLWPLGVFNGFNDEYYNKEKGKIDLSLNKELSYYLPTKIVVTGPDIIFLWITRMVISNYEYADIKPFEKVLFTGLVRDKKGRKMSKSLGNSPDIDKLIDKFSIDGIRYGMMSSSTGNDILFDEKILETGRNFTNKIWNAYKLLNSWEVYDGENSENKAVIDWFKNIKNKQFSEYFLNIDKVRISEALKDLYSFVWNDFCSWYLELIKPDYKKPIDSYTKNESIELFKEILSVLNPIIPFITEEIWSEIENSDGLCSDFQYGEYSTYNQKLIDDFEVVKALISSVRESRAKLQLKNQDIIDLSVENQLLNDISSYETKVKRLCNINVIDDNTKRSATLSIIVNKMNVNIHSDKEINHQEQKIKLLKDIEYYEGFIVSIEKKLSNDKFVNNAPLNVVENEMKKLSDGKAQLSKLKENLNLFAN